MAVFPRSIKNGIEYRFFCKVLYQNEKFQYHDKLTKLLWDLSHSTFQMMKKNTLFIHSRKWHYQWPQFILSVSWVWVLDSTLKWKNKNGIVLFAVDDYTMWEEKCAAVIAQHVGMLSSWVQSVWSFIVLC